MHLESVRRDNHERHSLALSSPGRRNIAELPRDKAITLSIFSAKFMPSAVRRAGSNNIFVVPRAEKQLSCGARFLGARATKRIRIGADFRRGKGFTVCPAN